MCGKDITYYQQDLFKNSIVIIVTTAFIMLHRNKISPPHNHTKIWPILSILFVVKCDLF